MTTVNCRATGAHFRQVIPDFRAGLKLLDLLPQRRHGGVGTGDFRFGENTTLCTSASAIPPDEMGLQLFEGAVTVCL